LGDMDLHTRKARVGLLQQNPSAGRVDFPQLALESLNW
jgi:hypothetical protein